MKVKSTDKILVVAPHPDDEVIACGGFIAKYHKQIDVLCINSSGVKYAWDKQTAEEIAQIRCDEFKSVMEAAGVKNFYITKIWGVPPMIKAIANHFNTYLNQVDFSSYDIILVPHDKDGHIEHRYVTNDLVKQLLRKSGYKKDAKILHYELWSPIQYPNYYEDITDYVDKKTKFIDLYVSRRGSHYAERILGLNKYRTLIPFFKNPEKFAEAFYEEDIKNYLKYNK